MNDLKSNSKRDFFGPCYLGKKCSDHECILIGLNSECCNKCVLPIHKKYSISQGLVMRDHYYCCRDCHVGEKMTGELQSKKIFGILKIDSISPKIKINATYRKLTCSYHPDKRDNNKESIFETSIIKN